jgi:hypothetical protein
VIYH